MGRLVPSDITPPPLARNVMVMMQQQVGEKAKRK